MAAAVGCVHFDGTRFIAATSARARLQQHSREKNADCNSTAGRKLDHVERIHVEKQTRFQAGSACGARGYSNVFDFSGVTGLRILNRYDVEEWITPSSSCRYTVFSFELRQTDLTYDELPARRGGGVRVMEYLPDSLTSGGRRLCACGIAVFKRCACCAYRTRFSALLEQ